MFKPRLVLPCDDAKHFASWNCTMHRMLAESGLFEVMYADLPRLPKRAVGRVTQNLSTFRISGTLVALDTWDTNSPTDSAFLNGHFQPGAALGDVRVVLKIQWQPDRFWKAFTNEIMIPVLPWTVFPSREFPLGAFAYDARANHVYTGSITGVMRYGRGPFRDLVADEPDFYARLGSKDDSIAEYVNILRTCRWGISLKGKRGTDGKNRREVEFASCGMPLALNYEPHYPFPFEAGQDYVLLKEPTDLLTLREIDPHPFAVASREVYEQFFSPAGMARLMLDLVGSATAYSGGT